MFGISDPGPVSRRTTSALSHHPPDWILNIYITYPHCIYTVSTLHISTLGNSECSHLSPVLYLTSDKGRGSWAERGRGAPVSLSPGNIGGREEEVEVESVTLCC